MRRGLDQGRQLVANDEASIVQRRHVSRSRFRGTKTHKTTFNAGDLIPFHWDEVYPGDHMRYRVTPYVRMSTPLFPMFDSQRVETFCFFVPFRILWANFKKFMGEQANPADSINYVVPRIVSAAGGFAANSIYDHMGVPPVGQIAGGEDVSVSALPFRAYNWIYNAWFRDQNVINSALEDTSDADETGVGNYAIRKRAKFHDYFTSCLPWPQKFTAPTIPVSGTAPIEGIGAVVAPASKATSTANVRETDGTLNTYTYAKEFWKDASGNSAMLANWSHETDGYPLIYANLAAATGVDVNTFRQAFAIQELLERDARGGTRYAESVLNHFGTDIGDHRVQRPEYIGGGKSDLNVIPIAQTATGGGGLGALGAAATATGQHSASFAVPEHGIILWLINVRSELTYQQGLRREFSRSTRYDFYWPEFAMLGEQAVLRQEIYCTGNAANDGTVFGYQERYHELRTMVNTSAGLFRSTTASNIDEWHLGQLFASAPTLSQTFIEDSPEMTRILAAGASANNMQYLADIYIERDAVRPMPQYGTPSTLSRF